MWICQLCVGYNLFGFVSVILLIGEFDTVHSYCDSENWKRFGAHQFANMYKSVSILLWFWFNQPIRDACMSHYVVVGRTIDWINVDCAHASNCSWFIPLKLGMRIVARFSWRSPTNVLHQYRHCLFLQLRYTRCAENAPLHTSLVKGGEKWLVIAIFVASYAHCLFISFGVWCSIACRFIIDMFFKTNVLFAFITHLNIVPTLCRKWILFFIYLVVEHVVKYWEFCA